MPALAGRQVPARSAAARQALADQGRLDWECRDRSSQWSFVTQPVCSWQSSHLGYMERHPKQNETGVVSCLDPSILP